MVDAITLCYLEEVPNTGWVHETINEIFDGALELMTENSVVFGGAVRDCIANKPLGDLDIAVSQEEYRAISKAIQTSPKWIAKNLRNPRRSISPTKWKRPFTSRAIPLNDAPIHDEQSQTSEPKRKRKLGQRQATDTTIQMWDPDSELISTESGRSSSPEAVEEFLEAPKPTARKAKPTARKDSASKTMTSASVSVRSKTLDSYMDSLGKYKRTNPYTDNTPMSRMDTFVGRGGKEIQLMTSSGNTGDIFQDAIYMARMVDIICCGVIMTADGRVFEVLPGAAEDCLNHRLRLNKDSRIEYIEALPERVKKLTERGWISNIDIPKVIRDLERRKAAERRRRAAIGHSKGQEIWTAATNSAGDMKYKRPSVHDKIAETKTVCVPPWVHWDHTGSFGYTSSIGRPNYSRICGGVRQEFINICRKVSEDLSIEAKIDFRNDSVDITTSDGRSNGVFMRKLFEEASRRRKTSSKKQHTTKDRAVRGKTTT